MNGRRLTDAQISKALRAHLPDRAHSGLRERIFDAVETTGQQRALPSVLGALRDAQMNTPFRIALAAAGVVAVALIGVNLVPRTPGVVGGPPSAPVPTATPAPLPSGGLLAPGRYGLGSAGLLVGSVPATLSITVPSGWSSGGNNLVNKNYGADAGAALVVWQISDRLKQPCTDHTLFTPAPGPGTAELLGALASQPGITAGPITDVTVDGYSGKYVELTVATDIATCPVDTGEAPLSGFWLWASPDGDRRYVQDSDEMDRIYAVDVGGTRFTFAARIPKRTTAADRAELQAIIDSIKITPPVPTATAASNPSASSASTLP